MTPPVPTGVRPAHPVQVTGWAAFVGGGRPALIAMLVATLLAIPLERQYRRELLDDVRVDVSASGMAVGLALSGALNHRMALLNGLRAFVEVHFNRPGFEADFLAYASRLQGSISGIRTVQWVQDGIIRQTYPLAGNERAIGYNLLDDPRSFIREDYRRSEQASGVVLSGPAELVQGGMGLISRMPARGPGGELLAVVAVVLDLPPILSEAGADRLPTLKLGLRSSGAGVFAGDSAVFQSDPVLATITLAEGEWQLGIIPIAGWEGAIAEDLFLARLALGLLALLTGLSAGLAAGRARARRREEEERSRRLGEEKFERLFALSPDAALLVRASDGVILEANDGVGALLGQSRDGVVGRTISELMQVVTSGDWTEAINAVITAGMVRSFPIQFRTPSGQVRHALYSGRTLDLDGVACVLSLMQDVTDQRHLEERLAHGQKLAAVGRLAGGIAHDFNNVITAISGYAQLLNASLDQEDPRRADAAEILKAATRAARLTQQLLAFARRQVVRPRVSDLNRMIHEVTRLLRRLLGERVELILDLPDTPMTVSLDPGQFEQVLVNLSLNARDAMPAGGRIFVTTRRAEGEVVLAVRDEGEGMSAEVQAMIFEPFFTTKEQGKGTGLGLATVYGIVEQSGGSITVESAPGRGSTFTIRLPHVQAAEEGETEGGAEGAAPEEGVGNILLAEDEPQVRRLAERTLTAAGYRVTSASNGAEALRQAQEATQPFDLLVTDLVMPELGGDALAREFRQRHPEAAVLIVSGYTDDDAAWQGLLRAGQSFLPKPFTPSELATRVRELLRARAGGRPR